MGPWPGDHGNITRMRPTGTTSIASMGPWPGDHGNPQYGVSCGITRDCFNGAVAW